MYHVNFCSGGLGSYVCGKRVAERHGTKNLYHLFTDTRSEDCDLYRFLPESVALTGGQLVVIADGRDLWELFNAENFIGNTRADLCSRVLKRQPSRRWIEERFHPHDPFVIANWNPADVTLYFGIDHSERRRCDAIRRNWWPYPVEFPLCEPPYLSKCDMLKECERDGIDPPRIYDEGFPHNNCNGFCVKAGHAHFLHLLKTRPDVFEYHAKREREFRDRTGENVAVLRDRRNKTTTPLPMYEFKRQVESGQLKVNPRDWGKGCRCFTPDADD